MGYQYNFYQEVAGSNPARAMKNIFTRNPDNSYVIYL